MALESSAFGVWDLNPRLDTVHYSPQWKARLGFPRIDAPDSSAFWRCRVHPGDVDSMLSSLRSHLDGSSPTYEKQFRLRSNGSGYRTVLSRGRVVERDGLGNATRMIGTMIDLTGCPASAANYGLAIEEPGQVDPGSAPPFHAILCTVRPETASDVSQSQVRPGRAMGAAHEGRRLIDLVDDLLDVAVRGATVAR